MDQTYFMGIDVSTTATKALLIDQQGVVAAAASAKYSYSTPRPLWVEQDPAQWWEAAQHSIQAVLEIAGVPGEQVACLGLTGQMHGLVTLDGNGHVLYPAILWNDQRTAVQCDEIRERVGRERLLQITGNDALTGFTAPKILWIRQEEPEVYEKIKHILLPKDYLRFCLTGEYAMDVADGSGTILMDLKARTWSDDILAALEISREWLPPLFEGPQVTGQLSKEAAALTGLPAGIPIAAGGGDQAAQAVGVGAVEEGILALTLGTSGVVFATANQPFIEPQGRLHAFCHALPGKWHLMGVMLSAAGSLRWYRDTFAPQYSFDELLLPANEIQAGSNGLIFLPYLTGERTPYADPLARAAFVGATVRHTQAHFTRAVLEGVAFGLRDSFDFMRTAGLSPIRQVRVSGGGSRSQLWRQILADVFQAELVTVNTTEGAAYGAALLAGVAAQAWPDVAAACQSAVQITGQVHPGESAPYYESLLGQYRALYPALFPIFQQMVG